MKILITGGAGYIGSTIASALIDAGHTPVILDNLVTGQLAFTKERIFYQGDIGDSTLVRKIFAEHPDIEATIHCAALIIVPESTAMPYEYYRENISKTIELFHTLHQLGSKKILVSSSASVYDTVPGFMVTESSPLNPKSPYARTKYMMEMILKDYCIAYGMWGIALRYFNPIGADPKLRSGLQIPRPSLVVGKMVDVALGNLPEFQITGATWPTRDGTGIRDYIHVWDLAIAHVLAVTDFEGVFQRAGNPAERFLAINLGNGRGVTVKELLAAFEKVWGKPIPKGIYPPRPGDVAGAYANGDTAWKLLNWAPEKTIEDAIRDALAWGERREAILGYK
jgi:UDP-glucose 4-epimerase